ncbi:NepR family anti-sigma factor [Labrys okinawensis]|uniref:NepR family anti-sigma factor n=1 Tax=Labrys okinawensis TaxID=346911 RepID=UPI0039BCCEC3
MSKTKEPAEDSTDMVVAPELDPQIQEFVARSLQAHYESIVRAPVPDRFLMLLAQLEDQERKAAEDKSDEQR